MTMLRDRYLAGVSDAEATFSQNSADEDSVTGALAQALATPKPVRMSVGTKEYLINIFYRKLRGRGPNAPEKRYGSDGLFQIAVAVGNEPILSKSLPFQAKINWRGRNLALSKQAALMEKTTPGGLVIDYSQTGYKACPAYAVIEAKGSRTLLDRTHPARPLGQILSRDFLGCTLGIPNLFFDPDSERYLFLPETLENCLLITTLVKIAYQDPPKTAVTQRQRDLENPSTLEI